MIKTLQQYKHCKNIIIAVITVSCFKNLRIKMVKNR